MSTNIIPLNNEVHANLKVKNELYLGFVEKEQIAPVVVHEFSVASANFPVFFVKNLETGQFQSVGMFGLEQGENLLVKDGKWLASHVPGVLANYPFKLITNEEDNSQLMLGLDHASDLVGEEDGEALFDAEGQETDYLKHRRDSVVKYFESGYTTNEFIAQLVAFDLLVPRNLTLTLGDKKTDLDGMYLVDEQKLNELSDEDFLTLRKRGFLPLIHAHLSSIHQIQRLIQMRMEQE